MPGPIERHVSGAVTPSGPTLEEFALNRIELIDSGRAGITDKKYSVIVHRDFSEMTGTWRRRNHVRDKLVVARAGLRPQDTHAFICIESRILPAIAEVDEIGCCIIEKTVGIRLDFEILNQPKTLTLENPDMAIEARYVQFVEVTPKEQGILSILE